jgi:hypothetical protein
VSFSESEILITFLLPNHLYGMTTVFIVYKENNYKELFKQTKEKKEKPEGE